MQYMLMIYEDENVYGDLGDSPALRQIVAEHMALAGNLGPTLVYGSGLQATATATTLRTTNRSKAVHDGPYAETKEQLGGFYVIDVPDLDAALAIAARIPLSADGAIEIRPLITH